MTGRIDTRESIWSGGYFAVTVGAVALIFFAALESLAMTTVMPVVSHELHGAALYAAAFAGTLATSVIGMVVAGAWCDRGSPVAPLTAAVGLFVAGLLVAGLAPTMWVFVAGRLLQGLGVGGQIVALYVVVARVYPPRLHGPLFAAFSATWVIPSLIGPFAAGAVAQYLHWRWVFLGVAVLTAAAFVLVFTRLHGRHLGTDEPSTARIAPRVWLAVAVAAGVLGLSLADRLQPWTIPVAAASVLVLVAAVLPLVPRGTLRAGRGLPSVVLMRGLIAGALFGSEVYLPYLLVTEYGFSVTWAGLALTVSAIAWAVGAALQGRFGNRLGNARTSILGVGLLTTATVLATATALGHLPPATAIAGWSLAGGGMGLMYPRMTVLTLAYSTPQNQGFNSSALSIFDAAGSATTIAVMGLVFTALQATDAGFAVVFALGALLSLLALVPGLRLGHAHEKHV